MTTLPRIKTFLWLLGHDRLLTKENCLKRRLVRTATCPRCTQSVESALHMLRDCPASRQIWSHWSHGSHFDHFCNLPLQEWLKYNLSRNNVCADYGLPWPTCFSFIYKFIWKFRNKMLFENGFQWPLNVPVIIKAYLRGF